MKKTGLPALLFSLTIFLILPGSTAQAQQELKVITAEKLAKPAEMMTDWLMGKASESYQKWDERYEALKTEEQIKAYQQQLREQFVAKLGGFPERTPLNAKITGTIQRDGYRVEKVLFESQPQHYVTGLCFVPEQEEFQAPYPAVLIVCGHSTEGKAYEAYQTAGALAALNGLIGFVIDPISQGERNQHLDENGKILVASSTEGHTLVGLGSILLGQNTARFEIWDGMRAVDYLQSREDVQADKIGCMGNSGGGTQTSYMMALEDRIRAAAPSCYITSFQELLQQLGPQDAEQNIHGQLAFGMDHADYLLMRAPTPILLCVGTQDFFPIAGAWDSFRKAKRLYTRLHYPERVSLTEVDEKHGWHQPLRESGTQWMVRWLGGRDIVVREPEIQLLDEKEVLVTEKGQVQLLPEARSVFDLNTAEFERLQKERQQLWTTPEKALSAVREIAGVRELNEFPELKAEKLETVKEDGLTIEKWLLQPEPGILLPALLYRPAGEHDSEKSAAPILYVHEEGKQTGYQTADGQVTPATLAKKGHTVLAVDLRGVGETAPVNARWYNRRFGDDGKHIAIAYLLGLNYVGLRAEDLLVTGQWFRSQLPEAAQDKIKLVSVGELGTAALHAAALEPELFTSLQLIDSITSWKEIVTQPESDDQFVHCVHGALTAYDLSDLIDSLGDKIDVVTSEKK